jgi:hypothetical protein
VPQCASILSAANALIGFDLRQMEGDVVVELPEEWIPSPIKIDKIE